MWMDVAKARPLIWAVLGAGLVVAGISTAQPGGTVPGLWNEATLYRDEYGTPHIQAATVRGMAFAFGYAQAEDHLEPMLMAYRVAVGRAAEVGGEPFANDDAFSIKIANAELAATALAAADPLTRDLCEGFALGVNAWILEHPAEAPAWAEGVQAKDVLAWWHYLMMLSAPFDLPGIYHPKPPLERGNAWALAPKNTLEGATLLVMSPCQYYDGPYRWYEAHLMIGGVNWAGATLFGVPVLMMGHNEHLGWAITPNQADTADFFREDIGAPPANPADPRVAHSAIADVAPLLSFMSNAKPFYVRTKDGLAERVVPSLVGARGPIFEGTEGALYSWRNGAFQQFGGLRQLLLMGQAASRDEFRQALAMQQFPGFQFLYADKQGNLLYQYNARLGNKSAAIAANEPRAVDWSLPLESIRDLWAWRELIPLDQLPGIEDPKSGYLQACGTPPWLATVNSGLNAADWPGWLVPERPSYRVFRVNQVLSSGRYSFADMRAMVFDTLVPAAVDMVPLLLSMADARPELIRVAHPDLVTALQLLKDWNLHADRESAATAFYNIWWAILVKRHAGEFNDEPGLYQGLLSNSPAAQAYALDAAAEAARIMRNDFSSLSLPWGSLHRIQRGGRNEAMFGTGTGDPVFLASNDAFVNRQWHANFGLGFAMAVQFAPRTIAASLVPFGASENPNSPHFDDQLNLMLDRRMKRTRFQYESVIRHAASGFGLSVALGSPGTDGTCAITLAQPVRVELEEIPDPPRPYPGGQVPFGPAVRPRFEGDAPPFNWEVALSAPEALCRTEHLSLLRLFSYTQSEGWIPVVGQRFDAASLRHTASGTGPVMIAVFGPLDARLDAAPVLAEADSPESNAPSDAFLRAPVPVTLPAPVAPQAPQPGTEQPAPEAGVEGEMPVPQPQPPVTPQNRVYDLEFLDQQPPQGGFGPGGAPMDGPEAEGQKEKRGIFAPLRKLKKSKPRTNFNAAPNP